MADSTPAYKVPKLASDSRRGMWALGIGAVIYLPLRVPLLMWWHAEQDGSGRQMPWYSRMTLDVFGWWGVFAATYAVLAWLAYRKLEGERLTNALRAQVLIDQRMTKLQRFTYSAGQEGPSWSAQLSLVALLASVTLGVNAALRSSTVMMTAGCFTIVASWFNVWVSYALHFGRLDAQDGGLDFPGSEPRRFSDYLYQGLASQLTFGSTDVGVTTNKMRKAIMGHALIAFAFNTVILAILLALLTSR